MYAGIPDNSAAAASSAQAASAPEPSTSAPVVPSELIDVDAEDANGMLKDITMIDLEDDEQGQKVRQADRSRDIEHFFSAVSVGAAGKKTRDCLTCK